MKIINHTGYRAKLIGGLFNAVGREIGLEKNWSKHKHLTLELHPAPKINYYAWTSFGWTSSVVKLYLPATVVPTFAAIKAIYPIPFIVKHGTNPAGVPAAEHWQKIMNRYGHNLIEYPKLPKPAPSEEQRRLKNLARVQALITKWESKTKYAESRLKTLRRRAAYYQRVSNKETT